MHTIGWVKVAVAGTVLTVGLFGASANAADGQGGDPKLRAADANDTARGSAVERKFRGTLTEKAQERAKQLKANADRFELQVAPVLRNVEKPFYSLTLTVAGVPGDDRNNPFVQRMQISKELAGKIIEHLLFDGFFEKATEWDTRKIHDRVSAEGYVLIARGIPNVALDEGLGWDLSMLRRLDDLRKVLDGDAAKAMDLLLGRMSGMRAEWAKKTEAAARENTERGVKGDPGTEGGGTVVFDSVSGTTVTYSVEGQGQTAIIARDSQGRMVWKVSMQRPVTSLRIEGTTVIAMPEGIQYDLANGKLLAIQGR
jgi:hypothetical protein